jgi:anti-anti-sigma factor
VTEPELHPVELRSVPLALARRSADHHATLMRELALVDASDDGTAPRRLLALSTELQAKYSRLGEAQRARADAAVAAGADTIDLHYEVPADLADDMATLQVLLDEVDEFCRGGELVTLVTPPELMAYRQWVFGEFAAQLRGRGQPTEWRAAPIGGPQVPTDVDAGGFAIITIDEDLDLEGSARARDEISRHLERGVTDLRVDLARCAFVDSVGISLLLTTLARLREAGGSLVLVNVSDAIKRTLHHAGILDLLVPG